MKFSELYQDNKKAVSDTLISMWCSNPRNQIQAEYAKKIRELVENELFASEQFMPLVQCMDRYKSVHSVSMKDAIDLVEGLWKKKYPPYEHQYQAWKALSNADGQKQSMVVTTGTGSGKTECFMLPLVHDLKKNQQQHQIEAIFLYPLNALMEDQKERLQELLMGTDLKFAVYNGNLPNEDFGPITANQFQLKQHERIFEERTSFPNIIPTRKEMHATPPNIMLTNPTMLEYMLLRKKDQSLFTPNSLKWIVIDETHTFSGAGAAELAMLIRRVIDAFGVEAKDIRFATSSATIGNASNQKEQLENDEKLRRFISDITGVALDQVCLISGERESTEISTDLEKERCRKLLSEYDYVALDELFPNGSIEDKLKVLDAMCGTENAPLKAKVHFFYRVPNNGLRIQLDDSKEGVFNLHSMTPLNSNKTPYLELLRCEHCGEYFAIAETIPDSAHKYRAMSQSDTDIFDFDSERETSSKIVLALTKEDELSGYDGNVFMRIEEDEYFIDSDQITEGWNIVGNMKKSCPHCHVRVLGNNEEESDEEVSIDEIGKNVMSFRLPAAFISRILAPSILPHLRKKDGNIQDGILHNGQQYISFVDSRQGAARATMQQNLEQERLWVYSRLFHELSGRKKDASRYETTNNQLTDLEAEYKKAKAEGNRQQAFEIWEQFEEIKENAKDIPSIKSHMTWMEIFNFLKATPEAEQLCYQFINKSETSDEIDPNRNCPTEEAKAKYIHSVMIEQLSKRPRKAAAPETMGLFTTYYPKLENIKELPNEVIEFNNKFLGNKKQIDIIEWKNLLKIFLDNVVRSNQSVYLRDESPSTLDIKGCQRFDTAKSPRRPVRKPHIGEEKRVIYPTVAMLIAKLIDENEDNLIQTAYKNRQSINLVLDVLWKNLTDDTKLLNPSEIYNRNGRYWDLEKNKEQDIAIRLNVVDISFKIYEKVYLCDTRLRGENYETLRPVESLFMEYSPYLVYNEAVKPKSGSHNWDIYPYLKGLKDNERVNLCDIHEWAKNERSLLWDNALWGKYGCFSNRLNMIYQYPNIFLQAEHTAQVDKLISRQSQDKFKQQEINILACSTTMEMGVDLGNLELVMMTSIPPHPSNYKQRAGRSGRNDDTRSTCITLCGSDAVGLRTLASPLEQLIKRPMAIPFVDMNSPQVIQRHVNAFLFRLSGIFFDNAQGNPNNLDQEVIEFFTPFMFDVNENAHYFVIRDLGGQEIYPNDLLGNKQVTKHNEFKKFLNSDETNPGNRLNTLIKNTCYNGEINASVSRCKQDIDRCYEELYSIVEDIAITYDKEKERLINSTRQDDRNKVKGNIVNSAYGYFLRHKYSEILSKNMISYLATNRFTPNANMPVEIIEFEKDLKNNSSANFSYRKSNNPSYILQDAISQYAPGNTIVLENRASIVQGVLYTGMYRQVNTFKNIFSDGNNTVIDSERSLKGSPKEWTVNGKNNLTLIEPVSFIPDINEDGSRIMDKNPYTQVSAQLIGADEWSDFNDSTRLITMRNNRDCGEAKILYYNEGIGYGYAFCIDCGKCVLEKSVAKRYELPEGMQNQEKKTTENKKIFFHYKINRRTPEGKPIECSSLSSIKRNVILGGLIQTDYSEIKIRKKNNSSWIDSKDGETSHFLITLGVLITKCFAEYIGKDRKDIDFSVMPNGHLCVFDTNPGGSGYSNQLTNPLTMQEVLIRSKETLDNISSKDALLDKFTIRYLDKLDIPTTKEWLELVIASFQEVPDTIKAVYPEAKTATIENILEDFRTGVNSIEVMLFVNSRWDKWLYQSDSIQLGWVSRVQEIRKSLTDNKIKVCVLDVDKIPMPIYSMMRRIDDWAEMLSSENFMPDKLMPVAIIKDYLYFTDQSKFNGLNFDWAKERLYRIKMQNMLPINGMKPIDVNYMPVGSKKFILGDGSLTTTTRNLGIVVEKEITDILGDFISHCKQNPSQTLKVVYQDEHLKSVLGMVTTLQFIEHFVAKIKVPFTLEFLAEEYWADKPCNSISQNMNGSDERDKKLNELTNEWIENIKEKDLNGQFLGICTQAKKSLPHWRELKFEYGNKALILYPNGGIINEWFLDRFKAKVRYELLNTSSSDEIPLYREKEIMYDAVLKI